MRVSTYLENAIDINRLKQYEYTIIETKSIPVIVNPSTATWTETLTNYTDVQIDFDMRSADLFVGILERCREYMSLANYQKAQTIRRLAFPVISFEYKFGSAVYYMPRTRIVGQLIAPLVETSGAGLQLIVTGRSTICRKIR